MSWTGMVFGLEKEGPCLFKAFRESLTGQEIQAALGYLVPNLYFYVFTIHFLVNFSIGI